MMQEKRIAPVSELKQRTKGFGVLLSTGVNSFHMSGEWQDSVFLAHAYAHESCFCSRLPFQLSWDLGKELHAGWVKHGKGADHCWSCFRLWFAEGSANTEPLIVTIPNTCRSSCLDELCKNTSKDPTTQSKLLQTQLQVASACPGGSLPGKTCL